MSTTIGTAEDKLIELLENAELDVPVLLGKPDPLPAQFVSIWEATAEREFATLGGKKLDEMVELTLVIDVGLASGSDFRPSRDRALEIADEVEAVISVDSSLGGIWFFSHLSKVKTQYFRTDKRRGCRAFQTLSGKGRI